MHIANVTVTSTWQDLESLISSAKGVSFSFDATKKYYLVNDGVNTVYLVDKEGAAPTEGAPIGLPLALQEQAGLKLETGKVYVATQSGTANLHIEEA
jgi:DNA-binding beta-propeller fold protein YncE